MYKKLRHILLNKFTLNIIDLVLDNEWKTSVKINSNKCLNINSIIISKNGWFQGLFCVGSAN